ncbi:MAG: PGF-pre-PGF domain-containing protein [Candidatus Aenigmatarchaeota archaeon]
MEKRLFFPVLFAVFTFLAIMSAYQTPVFYATQADGSVNLNIPTTPAPPGPPGGGGGGGAAPAENVTVEKIFEVVDVTNNSATIHGKNLDPANYFADTSSSAGLPITGVGIALRERTGDFRIIIETVDLPHGIAPLEQQYGLETPYRYLRVTVIGISPETAFRTISLNFRVDKGWILFNNIDEGTIALYRYDNGWKPLSAIRTGGDDYYSTFNAGDVRAFSRYFAISGKGLIMPPRLFAPAYVVVSMTYLQLAVLLFVTAVLYMAVAKRRRGKLAIEY